MNNITLKKIFILLTLGVMITAMVPAQETEYKYNYAGIFPSVLVEPYDNINAVEINIIPFVFEYKISRGIGIQIRSIINYRILEGNSGISQTGGTIVVNKYFYTFLGSESWLVPQIGGFYTYAYNQLDNINTMTLGAEIGSLIKISKSFSMNFNIQPGINYYPDRFSQAFVKSESGLKPHFGIIFHIGYNF